MLDFRMVTVRPATSYQFLLFFRLSISFGHFLARFVGNVTQKLIEGQVDQRELTRNKPDPRKRARHSAGSRREPVNACWISRPRDAPLGDLWLMGSRAPARRIVDGAALLVR